MTRRLAYPAYILAVLAIALTAAWAASLLPIRDPATAWAVCVTAGCTAYLAATTWIPCPCHRKDGR